MAGFSASQAIGSGFRVIARHPVAVLVWAVTYLVIGVLPQFAVLGAMGPDFVAYYQELAKSAVEHAGAPDVAQTMAFQSKMMALQPISLLASIVSQTVLLGAIFRAALTPEDNRFFYLRLGARELWLGLTVLVIVVLWIIMCVAVAIPVAIAGAVTAAVAGQGGSAGVAVLLIVALGFVGFGVIIWAMLRLSLAPAMSFAQRGFRLYESWPLTRGHALKLFGVALAVFVITLVLEVVILGGLAAVVFGLMGANFRGMIEATPQSVIHSMLPALLVFVPLAAVIGVGFYVVMLTPFADIYAQLTRDEVVA